jgi:plastocyanin
MLSASIATTALLLLPYHQFQDAHAQEEERVIRLLPGSSNRGATAYVEPSFYIVPTGEMLEFFNTDTEEHRIVVTSPAGDTVFDSGNMAPRGTASHLFSESGLYHFQCSIYPWMTGEVLATDDMVTLAKTSRYGFDVQLSSSPADPRQGEQTYFMIEFLEDGAHRQHVDFVLRLENATDGSIVHRYSKHSTYGLEFDRYVFDRQGQVNAEVEVYAVDFIPVEPDVMEFDIVVAPEFHLPAIVAAAAVAALLLLRRYRPEWGIRYR